MSHYRTEYIYAPHDYVMPDGFVIKMSKIVGRQMLMVDFDEELAEGGQSSVEQSVEAYDDPTKGLVNERPFR